jgi:hypothetical protein
MSMTPYSRFSGLLTAVALACLAGPTLAAPPRVAVQVSAQAATPTKGALAPAVTKMAPRSPYARAAHAQSVAEADAISQMRAQGQPTKSRKLSAPGTSGTGHQSHGAH